MTAESKRVIDGIVKLHLLRHIGHKVQVKALVWVLKVDGGG